ncbi:phage tail protein [Xanthomonas translucens]|uniref:Phage tail protein n=2 Tax=Xanthomonas campestris pv. translucens TaxID=343 RepID=A0A109HRV8_XANCT|nr:phage tail protein [Xanthomonas translucens]AVY67158.1 tail protein [Xanthomonas translucens pv. undulosa]KWV17130.1 phage tail protein [Xanthomonas translucens]MCT8281746.1 phage tail protein [Xanthomonas translucens pv. undulosa]MCT8316500.1 phage tail protein [Xanthomonas translucens pv. undulosa]QEN93651.1 phage tail protein [Xanthomonas translucens pv. undulosa]
MADTFTWTPTTSSRGTAASSVNRARFGDGYAQSSADGINPILRSHDLTFTARKPVIVAIAAFIDAHPGVSFNFTHPLHGAGLYQCDGYSDSNDGGGMWTLTATFEQTFQP